jgi:hypothetical protein
MSSSEPYLSFPESDDLETDDFMGSDLEAPIFRQEVLMRGSASREPDPGVQFFRAAKFTSDDKEPLIHFKSAATDIKVGDLVDVPDTYLKYSSITTSKDHPQVLTDIIGFLRDHKDIDFVAGHTNQILGIYCYDTDVCCFVISLYRTRNNDNNDRVLVEFARRCGSYLEFGVIKKEIENVVNPASSKSSGIRFPPSLPAPSRPLSREAVQSFIRLAQSDDVSSRRQGLASLSVLTRTDAHMIKSIHDDVIDIIQSTLQDGDLRLRCSAAILLDGVCRQLSTEDKERFFQALNGIVTSTLAAQVDINLNVISHLIRCQTNQRLASSLVSLTSGSELMDSNHSILRECLNFVQAWPNL